jgi:hypothetical protein
MCLYGAFVQLQDEENGREKFSDVKNKENESREDGNQPEEDRMLTNLGKPGTYNSALAIGYTRNQASGFVLAINSYLSLLI